MGNEVSKLSIGQILAMLKAVLGAERNFYVLAVIYGLGISLLSLATPISVQMVINTVANTGLTQLLVILSITLFILLLFSGLLNALRIHLMEIFSRRFYARMVAEISLRAIYAQNPFFNDDGRTALFNRYFDIITIQKTIPMLLVGGFTLVLQAAVGFILVSMYHPLFLAFNLVTLLLIWLVWQLWGLKAINTGIALSHKKYATAACLQGLATSNGFYKSSRHISEALRGADVAMAGYVEEHRAHFRQHFAQTISFLVIYAGASASLLGLGGWLVIQGQLSLGQLVAAELVLSAVFFGVSQLSTYLNYFYDLCASVEEISLVLGIPQENPTPAMQRPRANADLIFRSVGGDARGEHALLNMEIKCGSHVMAFAENHGVQRLITNLLKRHVKPEGGYISLGGADILDSDVYSLRQEIIILDRPTIIETTIRDYLRLSSADVDPVQMLSLIKLVGLEATIAKLENGLDTRMAVTGWPLSTPETMQLKLVAAMLAAPRLLIINQLYDVVPEQCIKGLITWCRTNTQTTIIYFTNRQAHLGFDQFLYIQNREQFTTVDFADYLGMCHQGIFTPIAISDHSSVVPMLMSKP